MRIIKHSELLSFLHGLNPNGDVSAEEIEDIIVDYNGQYMYTARITYNGYHCRWKCESVQYEHGNPDAGTGWGISGSDQDAVRTRRSNSASSLSIWQAMPIGGAVSPMAMVDIEETRRREFEESHRRIMNEYEGGPDTPVTRDRMASELRTFQQSVDVYIH